MLLLYIKYRWIFLFKLLSLTVFVLIIVGCSQPKPVQKEIKVDFKEGTIEPVVPKIQENTKRSEYFFSVTSPNATKVRILNIKPKYKDGMALKPGRYHIEVSAKSFNTHKEWIDLRDDTNLIVRLKKTPIISIGFIRWEKLGGIKHINSYFFQDQTINETKKMNWEDANKYCSDLVIKNNKQTDDDFYLPSESELKLLADNISLLDFAITIYWSSTVDKEHENFAKYVYVNNKKAGWYNKRGSTNVRCVAKRDYPLDAPLKKLTKQIMKEEKKGKLEATQSAVNIKFGSPIVENIQYNDMKQTLSFRLKSSKYDTNQKYYYDKKHTINFKNKDVDKIKVLLYNSYANPSIEFEIINDKLVFREIY